MKNRHIAVVILNYNSEKDLKKCAEKIALQEAVRLSIILVDNNSRPKSLASILKWFTDWQPDATYGTEQEVITRIHNQPNITQNIPSIYLITNDANGGYSAGNNIGLRLAALLEADATLIVNPDIEISDHRCISNLATVLFSNKETAVVGPCVINKEGDLQNPLPEPSFLQELLSPFIGRSWKYRWEQHVKELTKQAKPSQVEKLVGCCVMLKMSFVSLIGQLDENVFLYCEEAILASQTKELGMHLTYVPHCTVRHLHKGSYGDPAVWRKSRQYYLRKYKKYSSLKLALISVTQFFIVVKYRFFQKQP